MNRLILVGNGFDLAHGLKTSYNHFIDKFWKTEISIINSNEDLHTHANDYYYFDVSENIQTNKRISNYKQLCNFFKQNDIEIIFENKFLKTISEKKSLQNWVDIENEYYIELKKILTRDSLPRISKSKIESVNELNANFEEIKELLEDYLIKLDKLMNLNEKIKDNISSEFYIRDIISSHIDEFSEFVTYKCNTLQEFERSTVFNNYPTILKNFIYGVNNYSSSPIERKKFINQSFDNLGFFKKEIASFYPKQILFLNFNYTSTLLNYIDEFDKSNGHIQDDNISEIHIHGELNNPENPIIFGFGDDVDKKYQEFEDLNDNRYLENFKSIAYLQTDNYKKLLEFIDSEEYQVFIFGHSCGISDRTMLNTIFEHDNCKSIKPFYHRKKDDNGDYIVDDFGNFIDNYTEIVQNISRNFNDKKKYRDRVVNKTYCEPLT